MECGLAAVSRADYILDTPLSDYILDGSRNPEQQWYFNDVLAFRLGQQVRADVRLVNGTLEFFSSSTITSTGAPAGEKTFSVSGNVASIQYSFTSGGKLFVGVIGTDGTAKMVTPNFAHGTTTNATTLQQTGIGSDYILDGVQIRSWVDYNEESGIVRFRTSSTVSELDGSPAGNRTINKIGGGKDRINSVLGVYRMGSDVFVAAMMKDRKGEKLVILTSTYEAGTAAKVIIPETDYILD